MSKRAKVAAVPPPRPTEKQICNFKKLSKYFKKAQYSKSSHPGLLEKLTGIFDEMPYREFLSAFQTCLRIPFLRAERDAAVYRTLEFAARCCSELGTNVEEENSDGELSPFLQDMFKYLLENSMADGTSIRYRICQLINLIFSGLGEGVALDEQLADSITETMLKRLKDKTPMTRAQAVLAMERLQDPTDHDCQIIKAYKFHMEHDPSAQVRAQTLRSIAKTKHTVTHIFNRHLDVNDTVRLCCVMVLSKIHIRSLRIAFRDDLLCHGLKDKSAGVRMQTETMLLPAWFNCVEKDYVNLLHCLDLDTEKGVRTCQLVIDTLFKTESADSLVSALAPLQQDKVVLLAPDVQHCAAKVFFWRCVVRYLRDLKEDELLDSVLPELTPFCGFLRTTLLQTDWETDDELVDQPDQTFILLQLLEIAQNYDFADEMGRTSLYTLALDLLQSPYISQEAIPELVKTVVFVDPNADARLLRLAELISDIHAPLDVATQRQPVSEQEVKELNMKKAGLRVKAMEVGTLQEEAIEAQDFMLAQSLGEQLVALRVEVTAINERLTTVDSEGARKETNDPTVLLRCLTIVTEMMRSKDVKALTPTLRSLMQDFVARVYESSEDIQVRKLCLKSYACFCLLDVNLAREKIAIFYQQLADDFTNTPIGVMALTAVFDLYFYYGLQTFSIQDDIDLHYAMIVERRQLDPELITISDSSGSSASLSTPVFKYSVLHTLFNIFDDHECPLLHPVAANGFCKLLLSGRINSYRLLTRLLLMWHNPALDKSTQQLLSCFFQGYTCNRAEGLQLMVQSFVPAAEAVVTAPHNSPLTEVSVEKVLDLLVTLTKHGYNPNVEQNYHNNLAVVICTEVLADPNSDLVLPLTQTLPSLKVTFETEPQLEAILNLADRCIKKVSYDKTALKHVSKFYMTLKQLGPADVDSDTSVVSQASRATDQSVVSQASRATDQSFATTAGSNVTRITERMETIAESSPYSSPALATVRLRSPVVVSESDSSDS